MLLPQSSAFAALKNRLNSVSAIGYLHIAPRTYVPSHVRQKSTETKFGASTPQTPSAATFERPNRLKPREDSSIKWVELLDKFKGTQEKARRTSRQQGQAGGDKAGKIVDAAETKDKFLPDVPQQTPRPPSALTGAQKQAPVIPSPAAPAHKPKSSLSHLGRFAGGVAGRNKGKK